MPVLDKPDFRAKKPIPSLIKIVLLVATLIGIFITNKCQDNKTKYLHVSNIVVENYKAGITEAEVDFVLQNNSIRKGSEIFMIKIYGTNKELIAFKQVKIYLIPNSKRKYSRIIDKNFNRPPKQNEKLTATVNVYKPNF